jgi:CMP-N,N'-diacetyllegionaminic acid synthase
MSIIGLIPARGGSKGIPGKNIAPCAGRPLLAYTAESALQAKRLDRVILSTDDQAIAEIGAGLGIEVPFMRPNELSGDTASSLGVITHALDWLEAQGETVEAIVLLQPTSPLRSAAQIDEAIERFRNSSADTLVSVIEVPHRFHPESLMRMEGDVLLPMKTASEMVLRRQELPRLYARNGPAILIASPKQIRASNFYSGRTVAYQMPSADSLDIDAPDDLALAEMILAQRRAIRN